MSTNQSSQSTINRPSPFDPFLGDFLAQLRLLPEGYTPVAGRDSVASALEWPPAFVEAVFTSARARGYVEPSWTRGSRGRSRWQVSSKGTDWLNTHFANDRGVPLINGFAVDPAISSETGPA